MRYVIQKYIPTINKWYPCTEEYYSEAEAMCRLSNLRDMNRWTRYRLVQITVQELVLSV